MSRFLIWLPAFIALFPGIVYAQAQPLRWGMDETGGAPYVFDNQSKGFEIELADYLATELGRISKPVSGEWKNLPELLAKDNDADGIDMVMNGYEFGADFREQATIPYYIYRLVLVVAKDDREVLSWEDLHKRKPDGTKRKIVALTGSAAYRYLEKTFGDSIELKSSDDVSSVFGLVATREFDATVQDNPAARYFVDAKPESLRIVDEGRQANWYVILTRTQDVELREKLNAALRKGLRDGTLEAIYRKYHLWNTDQQRLIYWAMQPWPPTENLDPEDTEAEPGAKPRVNWREALGLLGKAALTTIALVLFSFPIAMVLGLIIALVRLYAPGWLACLARIWVELVRGTPLLLQLFVIFYLLPQILPVSFPPMIAGIIGLALNYSAAEAENIRAGFQSIPQGQMEAALALGMTPANGVRRVLLPQAIRVVIPPITNDIIAMFKDSSVCSVILITELTRQYNVLYNNHREHIITFAILTATLYLMMSFPLSLVARNLERRFGQAKR